jgi:hypothetical protein
MTMQASPVKQRAAGEVATIDHLAEETLEEIFTYLPLKTFILIGLVYKRWLNHAESDRIWGSFCKSNGWIFKNEKENWRGLAKKNCIGRSFFLSGEIVAMRCIVTQKGCNSEDVRNSASLERGGYHKWKNGEPIENIQSVKEGNILLTVEYIKTSFHETAVKVHYLDESQKSFSFSFNFYARFSIQGNVLAFAVYDSSLRSDQLVLIDLKECRFKSYKLTFSPNFLFWEGIKLILGKAADLNSGLDWEEWEFLIQKQRDTVFKPINNLLKFKEIKSSLCVIS